MKQFPDELLPCGAHPAGRDTQAGQAVRRDPVSLSDPRSIWSTGQGQCGRHGKPPSIRGLPIAAPSVRTRWATADGGVEWPVGYARRNFVVPVPRKVSQDEFNAWLEEQCRRRQADTLRGHGEPIGQRPDRNPEAMADLPAAPFDTCDQTRAESARRQWCASGPTTIACRSPMAIEMSGCAVMSTGS